MLARRWRERGPQKALQTGGGTERRRGRRRGREERETPNRRQNPLLLPLKALEFQRREGNCRRVMGAMAPAVPWTPDDDVLLKNAVEAGASVESLAKGAVEFSRRYTIREVKERWLHIIYNQDKAMETSMYVTSMGLEAGPPGNLKPGKLFGMREKEWPPGKRKSSSIRSIYYSLRKRVRSGQVNSPEVDYLAPASAAVDLNGEEDQSKTLTYVDQYNIQDFDFGPAHDAGEQGVYKEHVAMEGNLMTDEQGLPTDDLFEFEEVPPVLPVNEMVNSDIPSTEKLEARNPRENQNPNLEVSNGSGPLQNLGFSSPLMSMTIWGGIDATPTLPMDPNLSSSNAKEMIPEDKLRDDMGIGGMNNASMIGDNEFVDLSLEFEHEDDELFLLNEEEKDMMDGPCLETLNAIFSDSPTDVCHDAAYDVADSMKDVEEIIAQDMVHDEFKFAADQKGYEDDDRCALAEDINVSSSETAERLMICTLNTEDWEIPCNDDVILPSEVVYTSVSSRGGVKKQEPESGVVSFTSKITSLDETQMHAKRLNDDFKVKTEFQGMESGEKSPLSPAIGLLTGSILTPKEEVGSVDLEKCGDAFQEKPHEPLYHPKTDRAVDSAGPSQRWAAEPEFGDPRQNFSASADDDDLSSDSDEEMAHFSDVESMILEMDLAFSDQEPSLFAREVSRYQFLESKKTLMRLEKSAQSRIQRSIASRGAFAVLYGRYLRHYFRKPEVSLGRGTDDIPVDIDLKKEGPANKISRRQAIIKMDEQGTFYLKNTGKFPILNNGSEVPPGVQVNISSGCLIDIRGMKFIFEVCPSRVSRYIANTWPRKGRQELKPSVSLVAT